MNEFQNYVVLPKYIYLDLKKSINLDTSNSNPFERDFLKILQDKKLNSYQKWDMYKYLIIKHGKNKTIISEPSKDNNIKIESKEQTTQTYRPHKMKSVQTETDFGNQSEIEKLEKIRQSETTPPPFTSNTENRKARETFNAIRKNPEEIFDSTNINDEFENANTASNNIFLNENAENSEDFEKFVGDFNTSLNEAIFEKALQELQPDSPLDIVRRQSSVGKNIVTFENRKTYDRTDIDALEIAKDLYNKSDQTESYQSDNRLTLNKRQTASSKETNSKPSSSKNKSHKVLNPVIKKRKRYSRERSPSPILTRNLLGSLAVLYPEKNLNKIKKNFGSKIDENNWINYE